MTYPEVRPGLTLGLTRRREVGGWVDVRFRTAIDHPTQALLEKTKRKETWKCWTSGTPKAFLQKEKKTLGACTPLECCRPFDPGDPKENKMDEYAGECVNLRCAQGAAGFTLVTLNPLTRREVGGWMHARLLTSG